MHTLIEPHGGTLTQQLVEAPRADTLARHAADLPVIRLSPKQSCDLEMIAVGAFSPLRGFMGERDFRSVCARLRLADGPDPSGIRAGPGGEVWPIPILLAVPDADAPRLGSRVALLAPSGILQGVMTVTERFPHDKHAEVPAVFRTSDPAHPGVKSVLDEGPVCLAGPVEALVACTDPDGPEAFIDDRLPPRRTRAEFLRRGWRTVAAFQTRNPIHRAHEYLCKVAQEICDGLLIHPLVGETKPGDIPAAVRMECYRTLISKYFVPQRTMLSVMPAAMRYAGPREAVLHAIVRQNYGCTHFIVGRDHAGVGNYYGSYDAQKVFDELPPPNHGGLHITPLKFEHAAYSRLAQGMVSPKTFPAIDGDQVTLSGSRVRELLAAGERPPPEFTRPEVADALIRWARAQEHVR